MGALSPKLRGQDEGGTPYWYDLTPGQQALLRAGARDLRPCATPRFTRVALGTRVLAQPASYAGLFDPRFQSVTVSTDDWTAVTIDGPRDPWTDGVIVTYSPAENVLALALGRFTGRAGFRRPRPA